MILYAFTPIKTFQLKIKNSRKIITNNLEPFKRIAYLCMIL